MVKRDCPFCYSIYSSKLYCYQTILTMLWLLTKIIYQNTDKKKRVLGNRDVLVHATQK